MYLIAGALLQLRLGRVWIGCNWVLMTWVLLDFAQTSGFEVAAFLLHLTCFTNSTSGLFEPYLFSGSSSSSAAHEGPDCSSSPIRTNIRNMNFKIKLSCYVLKTYILPEKVNAGLCGHIYFCHSSYFMIHDEPLMTQSSVKTSWAITYFFIFCYENGK